MKPTKRALRVLSSKVKQMNPKLYNCNDYWGVCATPTEILILVDVFGVKHNEHPYHIKWIRRYKKAGSCAPMWFYFHIGQKDLLRLFGSNKYEKKKYQNHDTSKGI